MLTYLGFLSGNTFQATVFASLFMCREVDGCICWGSKSDSSYQAVLQRKRRHTVSIAISGLFRGKNGSHVVAGWGYLTWFRNMYSYQLSSAPGPRNFIIFSQLWEGAELMIKMARHNITLATEVTVATIWQLNILIFTLKKLFFAPLSFLTSLFLPLLLSPPNLTSK